MQRNFGAGKMDADLSPETWLATPYKPVAIYLEDCDSVEYVNEDAICIYRRVDSFLTLIYDKTMIDLVGFKFKGAGWFYQNHLAKLPDFCNIDFVEFVKVIEALCTFLGDELIQNEKRQGAYKAVRKLAEREQVTLPILPLAA